MPSSSRTPRRSRVRGSRRLATLVTTAATCALTGIPIATQPAAAFTSGTSNFHKPSPQTTLTQVSSDPFTNSSSQHATELEPDTFAYGNTIVSSSQVGRFTDGGASDIGWNTSTDGGAAWQHGMLPWSSTSLVANVRSHAVAGNLRDGEGLPSAEIDASGRIYVAWQDCRFRSGCPANDIVYATSTNGTSWPAVTRIPIDATTSGADHFIPGLGVDHATSGSTAKIGLHYYFYPEANCSASTCQLEVGYLSSTNGGSTWSTAQTVAGPMPLNQIASTSQGSMVGDYLSASVIDGKAVSVFAVGKAPTGGQPFNEALYTAGGLAVSGGPVKAQQATHDLGTRLGRRGPPSPAHRALTAAPNSSGAGAAPIPAGRRHRPGAMPT
ncbi:hypothetical protein MOV08_42535 [Streptomyces yunnanensis]|uniref:BNR repeat-like domain-containing protein n=1 Tax=Streptomyces yunnanensis TaxID=156453 RepID=A0ABY8AJW5_9ACTN|nr:hypothetical protein [Streptomyces yunnanensis]WEB45320.1 hypothetical protein MOV08_42535 [Streptomyces yunnanensis]